MRLHPAFACLLLAACAAATSLPDVSGVDALLLGEQHDASTQPPLQQRWVDTLARSGRLGALTLEMADRGHSTAGLPSAASEEQVRQALDWNRPGGGWPWERYAPAIMTAVRAGVPVLGANLPREEQRAAMKDETLEVLLAPAALHAQEQAIRRGHCDLLPDQQVLPMTRVQIARDRAMAQAIATAAVPGKTVVLIAGAGHVAPDLGVPQHLPRLLAARSLLLPGEDTGKDYCAELRKSAPGRTMDQR
jgi:uncharacterized iron-regulated protein